jgi:hypothetical protein
MPGDEANGGKSGDEGKGAAGDVQQQLTDIQAKLATMEGDNKSLKDAKVDLEQRLDEADKELLSDEYLDFKEKKGKSAPAKGGEGEELDLDRASNREIASFIEKKYKGDIDAAVKDIRKDLDLSKRQIGMIAAQFDVAITTIKHDGKDGKPGFEANQKAIFEIAKTNPSWSAEQCYRQFILQAKANSDKKTEDEKKKVEEEEKAATEKAGVPGSVLQGKQLTKEEAAAIAYRKAFGNKE